MLTQQNPLHSIAPCNLFKYRLKELFIFCFGDKDTEKKKEFADQQGLHINQIYDDFNIRLTEGRVIPKHRQEAYAELLKTTVEQIRNRLSENIAA
jgi:hypothetical protein